MDVSPVAAHDLKQILMRAFCSLSPPNSSQTD